MLQNPGFFQAAPGTARSRAAAFPPRPYDFPAGNILLLVRAGAAGPWSPQQLRLKAEAAISVNRTLAPAIGILIRLRSFSPDCCTRDTASRKHGLRAWTGRCPLGTPPSNFTASAGKRGAERDSVRLFFSTTECYTSKKWFRCGIALAAWRRNTECSLWAEWMGLPTYENL